MNKNSPGGKLFFLLLGALVLMGAAFYNGFPLVFSDTGMYIKSGMEGFVPVDRPILYGLLIRGFAFVDLWGLIFFQSFTLSYLLWSSLPKPNMKGIVFLILLVLLSFFSSVSWYCGQLMPDIWIAIACLAFFVLYAMKEPPVLRQLTVALILCISLMVHFSHLAIFLVVLVVTGLYDLRSRKFRERLRVYLFFLAVLIASILGTAGLNAQYEKGFQFATGSNTFYMGWLLDAGILDRYLSETTQDPGSIWAVDPSDLPPTSRELLWSPESIVQQAGGWEVAAEENGRIIRDILGNPKYWPQLIRHIFISTAGQVLQNDVGSGLPSTWYRREGSPPFDQIAIHFPGSLRPYLNSRQNGNLWEQELNFNTINAYNRLLIFLSALLILGSYTSRIQDIISEGLKKLRNVALLFIVSNAVVCAGLANVYDRLQSRISWLLILVGILIIMELFAHFVLTRLHQRDWMQSP
ncbi:MAG: hypothetical protein H6606_09175 [Flavobacteriales bacterium]|nr:hypothetical protein [Flavobacteriales bacterium]